MDTAWLIAAIVIVVLLIAAFIALRIRQRQGGVMASKRRSK